MKTFVIIPTYNEKENIKNLINSIFKLKIPDLEVVIIDDNSPDKTWEIVENLKKKNKKIHLILRKKDRGRGFAGKEGFKFALKNKADYIIEMDADFSHDPRYIPLFLEEIKNADLVLGSRLVKGGKDIGRGLIRRLITKIANLYIQLMLGLRVKDCNSGYRCFRSKVIKAINPDKIKAKGPDIVQEVLYKAHLKGFRIKEIPIEFIDRKKGKSKLGIQQLSRGYWAILKLKLLHLFNRV